MSFRRTWGRFGRATRTLGPTPGAREAWHQGRRWYHVTLLRLDEPSVIARRDMTLAALADVLVPFAVDDPHVTVFVHGFAEPTLTRRPSWEDQPLDIEVGAVNAFRSCVFLEVRAPGLAALRARFPEPEERWSPYQPHVTVGLFRASGPVLPLVPRLRALRRLPPIRASGLVTTAFVDAFDPSGAVRRLTEL